MKRWTRGYCDWSIFNTQFWSRIWTGASRLKPAYGLMYLHLKDTGRSLLSPALKTTITFTKYKTNSLFSPHLPLLAAILIYFLTAAGVNNNYLCFRTFWWNIDEWGCTDSRYFLGVIKVAWKICKVLQVFCFIFGLCSKSVLHFANICFWVILHNPGYAI